MTNEVKASKKQARSLSDARCAWRAMSEDQRGEFLAFAIDAHDSGKQPLPDFYHIYYKPTCREVPVSLQSAVKGAGDGLSEAAKVLRLHGSSADAKLCDRLSANLREHSNWIA